MFVAMVQNLSRPAKDYYCFAQDLSKFIRIRGDLRWTEQYHHLAFVREAVMGFLIRKWKDGAIMIIRALR
ncbi:hypothetical protein L596_017071 [Steinernema carpocapsae]|uniref:Uncharacterized protein n=1 Tax=Steinernema carpocapsae TaxID=34508 RepID=A0A4U5N0W9_STECR|nr:hypothetical protein L596_017071 [Steinernema carpocapsae]